MNRRGKTQRWRGVGVEQHGGRRVAVVRAQDSGHEHRVYFRLGAWRYWDGGPTGRQWDQRVHDKALAATARRTLKAHGVEAPEPDAQLQLGEAA
jgi:hypothetical protein